MSYVVLSNTTNDNERLTGISSAESFQNNFKSPLIVEPNSEIAVESIKINRKDDFDITADDEFFVYFGEELTDNTPSGSNVTNAVKIDIPVGSYTRKSFAATLQDLINAAPLNPAIAYPYPFKSKADKNLLPVIILVLLTPSDIIGSYLILVVK